MNGSYVHRQTAVLWFACLLPSVILAGLAAFLPADVSTVLRWILGGAAALFVVLALSFVWLETRDSGDALQVCFGPFPSFSLNVRYTDIRTAARGRSALIDGWGIHYIPGRGWTWNLWGRDCVELELKSGRRIRIGTDDPDGLLDAVILGTGLPR